MVMNSPNDIFFFYPNIIGYARIILALISFVLYMDPVIFFTLYTTSFLLDALDGYVARKYNQCSKFGAVLDMVTDRFGTTILCLLLSHLYPEFLQFFIAMIVLDFTSHWVRMYSTLMKGSSSHKQVTRGPTLLKLYYTNKIVLGGLCLFNELFYIFFYMSYFYPIITIPLDINFNNVIEIPDGFWLLTLGCFPLFALKQIINVIQLVVSSQDICITDYEQTVASLKN
eukprot:TRINITY_DN13283_c0_g1_i1.p1 TRINITY_DN13283_c0_g1~~TRINITY_DN13283_c0_g1_i1.p1  ORF type:complete len:227 (-),score=47.21 TRINITY_DN13283_c0_g1_i1:24-704(-)